MKYLFFILWVLVTTATVIMVQPSEPDDEAEPTCYTRHYYKGRLHSWGVGERRMIIDGEPCLSIVYDLDGKEIKRTNEAGVFVRNWIRNKE